MARTSHVEARSRRYAPRQYVSETHWHKPDAPTSTKIDDAVEPIDRSTPDAGTE